MLGIITRWYKQLVVTLRFSLLAVFVTLFILSMMALILISYFRFIHSMEGLSFKLMHQSSTIAFNQIHNQLKNAEAKSYSIAQLIKLKVIDINNNDEIISYGINFMQQESDLFYSIRSIAWGSVNGNFVLTEKTKKDNKIYTTIINRISKPPYQKVFTRDTLGNMIEVSNSKNPSYDPRIRPWYIAAEKSTKPVWMGVYTFELTGFQGTSVSTPVFDNGHLLGVVSILIRLDNLQRLVEKSKVSPNSIVFIVSNKGRVIAFPQLNLLTQKSSIDIRDLKSSPWIVSSFNQYSNTHREEFILRYLNKKYLVTYQFLSTFGNERWMIGIVAPENDFVSTVNKTQLITLLINLFILVFGVIVVSILTTRVVRPLKKITEEINRIKQFDLKSDTHIESHIKEINFIADALSSMKNGLRIFQRYVPSTLVKKLIETGEDARIGGVKIQLAILFSDIKDFTTIAEQMDPEELTPHICQYFDELTQIIMLNNGTIDKYIGDAIMAFWGAPEPVDEPAINAAKAALRCIARCAQLNKRWVTEGKPVLYTRIGIHLGDAIVGNLGSSERINYTAVGDTTNIASRLENINKLYGTQIIVSDTVYHNIKDQFILRMIDSVTLKGKHESCYIYELIAETRHEVSYDLEKYSVEFNKGFTAYKNQQWDKAISSFKACLAVYPLDTVAPVFIHRCEHFKLHAPDDTWNGTWQLHEK